MVFKEGKLNANHMHSNVLVKFTKERLYAINLVFS